MEKEREEKAEEIIREIETFQEAFGILMDEGYDSIEAAWILRDFLELTER